MSAWLDEIRWIADGLAPVVAQEAGTGQVLKSPDSIYGALAWTS